MGKTLRGQGEETYGASAVSTFLSSLERPTNCLPAVPAPAGPADGPVSDLLVTAQCGFGGETGLAVPHTVASAQTSFHT